MHIHFFERKIEDCAVVARQSKALIHKGVFGSFFVQFSNYCTFCFIILSSDRGCYINFTFKTTIIIIYLPIAQRKMKIKWSLLKGANNVFLVPKTFEIHYCHLYVFLYSYSLAERLENAEFEKNKKSLKRAFRPLC